mmetsp:Transcript_13795/g.34667  ORF Transcript_13795/g.34667 Transcript_13795/m.34667 type:complete len:473 (-) Transcript_13795:41-1459(-)
MEEASTKKKRKKTPPSALESISKREKLRKNKVIPDPGLLKVQDALEHIIVTGAKVRRDDWRRHEFEHREENRPTPTALGCPPLNAILDTAKTKTSGNRPRKRNRPLQAVACHAEDLRIYGERHYLHLPPFASKTAQSGTQQDDHRRCEDSEWNFEHGDSIPPILFRMARLSRENPSQEQMLRFNDPKATLSKSFTSTDITLPQHDIPRALIEKCWERAVHIASNTMVVPVVDASQTAGEASEIDTLGDARWKQRSSSSLPFRKMPLSRESCQEKCESLGIDMESLRKKSEEEISETTCPRCTRSFSTTDELLDHYYGTTETFGCCRALIRPRHLDLIRDLLQNYAESQTDQLATIFFSQNRQDDPNTNEKEKGQKPQQLWNWTDVHRYMQHAVEYSTPIPTDSSSNHHRTDARHPVQESMAITSGATICNDEEDEEDEETNSSIPAPPLMLNQMVLDAVHRRLIDRYAEVPP